MERGRGERTLHFEFRIRNETRILARGWSGSWGTNYLYEAMSRIHKKVTLGVTEISESRSASGHDIFSVRSERELACWLACEFHRPKS